MQDYSPPESPRDGIFTTIMWVLIANVMIGAVMSIAAETMGLSPAVGNVGFGLVVVCGSLYFFFRWFQRKEARRRSEQRDDSRTD